MDYETALKELRRLLNDSAESIVPGTAIEADEGDCIIEQGQRVDAMYQIVSGRVRIEIDVHRDQSEIALLEAGDVFGEIGLITGQPATANCVADVPTELKQISREDFNRLMQDQQELYAALAESAHNRRVQTRTAIHALRNYNN